MGQRLWPVELSGRLADGSSIGLRPLRRSDKDAFFALRQHNRDWLRPWEPTNPDGSSRRVSFARMLRTQREQGRAGRVLAFGITVDGSLAGQLNVSNIELGAFRSCTMGYWVGEAYAGRGVTPTAVALAGDYVLRAGNLHRIEINIRPENLASLAVVRKLGFRAEGLRPNYLHIDGDWRDHLSFAVTSEDLGPRGLIGRL
ncbi:MAG TPA: GNAT family N-acetyltransferase [Tetrasphaera sp.]|uniref:GNAT family N-acetyltransferase n=1 Tax=Nostocoides sp. TaxID=1917966 RepID=UPI002CBE2963|nr:GNAT family N-acetyltransferase [Tetrasphaera sp.]HNQ07462.1 GNAT family N-acetyltransferase [Tetrasphaera sp.]